MYKHTWDLVPSQQCSSRNVSSSRSYDAHTAGVVLAVLGRATIVVDL